MTLKSRENMSSPQRKIYSVRLKAIMVMSSD